jgi:Zn-dependent alcohol dehydrogenase
MLLTACIFSSESQNAVTVANAFWQAVQDKNMEKAKELSTWDSAQYLKFIESDKLQAQRFETGEVKILDQTAEVATILYGSTTGDVKIPVRTILVRVENDWRVDVQKTMGSMVSGAMGAVVNELNTFMRESLKGVDQALSKGIGELGKSLDQGLKQLQKDLKEQDTIQQQKSQQTSDQAI